MISRAPRTQEQQIADRAAEIGWQQQMEADHAAERAERESEHNEFAQRVQARRDAIDSYIRRSFAQRADESMSEAQLDALHEQIRQEAYAQARPTITPLEQLYAETAEQERLAAEEAERQRLAALTPRDIWLSTLPWAERQRIAKWEHLQKVPYPIPLSALNAIKAARAEHEGGA